MSYFIHEKAEWQKLVTAQLVATLATLQQGLETAEQVGAARLACQELDRTLFRGFYLFEGPRRALPLPAGVSIHDL